VDDLETVVGRPVWIAMMSALSSFSFISATVLMVGAAVVGEADETPISLIRDEDIEERRMSAAELRSAGL
jgi:hypothetical protein